jgi:hypothetical protein
VLSMLAAGAPAAADEPSLATVLERAAAYVADFHRQLASIVAEERYVQDWKVLVRHDARPVSHRVLLGDLLLVKPGPDASWMEFRDVFEVDGHPVREHDQRLERMFLRPSASTSEQIGKILTESARFNIGDINRNVNTPLFPLVFLEAANHYRFKFKQTRDRQPAGMGAASPPTENGAFRVATEVWVVAYDEREPGTMIRTTLNRDLPSHGRFWIEPASGRVLMSELIADTRWIRATIDVRYQSGPLLGLLVPIEMRERYEGKRNGSLVEGRATYGKFRQFTVNTDEQFLLKK